MIVSQAYAWRYVQVFNNQYERLDVILSLVRTKNVGHLRDVRRLVVAMSRSCLGLYVLGRFSLFHGCPDLAPVFDKFNSRDVHELTLYPEEKYGTVERPCEREQASSSDDQDVDDDGGKHDKKTPRKKKSLGRSEIIESKTLAIKSVQELGKFVFDSFSTADE